MLLLIMIWNKHGGNSHYLLAIDDLDDALSPFQALVKESSAAVEVVTSAAAVVEEATNSVVVVEKEAVISAAMIEGDSSVVNK